MFHPMKYRVLFLYLIVLCRIDCVAASKEEEACQVDGSDTTCSNQLDIATCNFDLDYCRDSNSSKDNSLYRYGGNAQAYKADVPIKFEICSKEVAGRYRPASWAYSRKNQARAPQLALVAKIWQCSANETLADKCCCRPVNNNEKDAVMVEVWQAKPDGTYSSLRKHVDDGVCRARLPVTKDNTISFSTYAPGSTGSLGGLGPTKIDFIPYGPPLIHLLVSGPQIQPTLMDVPILFDLKTLQQTRFSSRDWRGSAWTNRTLASIAPYKITSWEADTLRQSIKVTLDIFVSTSNDGKENAKESYFCTSFAYNKPTSFFSEPMSICGSSILDFFAI